MEIHAPHEPIHTKKDFFIHLFTITVGLLIALSLEGLVEYAHHRHLVREARENIRQELEDNHQTAQKNIVYLDRNIATTKANIAAIHRLQLHPKDFHGSISNDTSFVPLDDAAWRTSRDTGAISYMPYAEVQRYSSLYLLESIVNQKAVSTAEQSFHAHAPIQMGYDIDQLPDEEYMQMLRENAATQIELLTLKQVVKQLDDLTVAELKQ